MQLAALAPLAVKVAARLGITEAAVTTRLQALAIALSHSLELEVEEAAAGLIARGVDDVAKLIAHGPAEQVRASLTPEQVDPPQAARATIGGHIPLETEEPAETPEKAS